MTYFTLLAILVQLIAGADPENGYSIRVMDQPFTSFIGETQRTVQTAVYCEDGKAVLRWYKRLDEIGTLVHEFAHVYDCVDNGVIDSSPLEAEYDPSSEYCSSAVERYACYVQEERRLK